jgi:hypothetical protein
MIIFNYIFYRISQWRVYRPTYWARIFVPVIEVMIFLPIVFTLLRYHFGCSAYQEVVNGSMLKLVFSVVVVLVMIANNYYYSPSKIRKLQEKYLREPKARANLRLFFICILLFSILLFGSAVLRYFISMPEC